MLDSIEVKDWNEYENDNVVLVLHWVKDFLGQILVKLILDRWHRQLLYLFYLDLDLPKKLKLDN